MELKKDAQGNQYVEVAVGPGNAKVRVTLHKAQQTATLSSGDQTVTCKVGEIPTLIEALANVYAASIS